MSAVKRLLRRVCADERGVALPLALVMLVTVLLLAGVALATATRSLDSQQHDLGRRKAAAAALSGLRMETYRMNKLKLDLSAALRVPGTPVAEVTQCLVGVGTSGFTVTRLASVGGSWCPSLRTELGDGASFATRTSALADLRGLTGAIALNPGLLGSVTDHLLPNVLSIRRDIVSTGSAYGVERRFLQTVELDLRLSVSTQTVLLLTRLTKLRVKGSLYTPVAGSLRECTPTPPNPADPRSGC